MNKICTTLFLLTIYLIQCLGNPINDTTVKKGFNEKDAEEAEIIANFKAMDNDLKAVEIKRKLMQTLGGINDIYDKTKVSSIQTKSQLLTLLRKLQNMAVSPNEAKVVFKNVAENLQNILQGLENDLRIQRASMENFKEIMNMPIKTLKMVFTLISIW